MKGVSYFRTGAVMAQAAIMMIPTLLFSLVFVYIYTSCVGAVMMNLTEPPITVEGEEDSILGGPFKDEWQMDYMAYFGLSVQGVVTVFQSMTASGLFTVLRT